MAQSAKAVVTRAIGKPVTVEQIQVEEPRHGEVTIRLAACGVCCPWYWAMKAPES
jgi:Zn-dependent alcohol dehydrogenase